MLLTAAMPNKCIFTFSFLSFICTAYAYSLLWVLIVLKCICKCTRVQLSKHTFWARLTHKTETFPNINHTAIIFIIRVKVYLFMFAGSNSVHELPPQAYDGGGSNARSSPARRSFDQTQSRKFSTISRHFNLSKSHELIYIQLITNRYLCWSH